MENFWRRVMLVVRFVVACADGKTTLTCRDTWVGFEQSLSALMAARLVVLVVTILWVAVDVSVGASKPCKDTSVGSINCLQSTR